MQFDDAAQQAESEITFLSYASSSLRADFGLPETGWEDEVRRGTVCSRRGAAAVHPRKISRVEGVERTLPGERRFRR